MPEEMQITAEWIDQKLTEHFPRVAEDLPSLTKLADKVQWYANEVGKPPTIQMAVGWASGLESELRAKAETEAAEHQREQERIDTRERQRADYLSGSDADKAQAIAELKDRSRPEERAAFVPARSYSEAELDAMDSETYRKEVLGITNRVEDRQGTSSLTYLKPERLERRVRTIKLSPQEEQSRQYRERVIAADKEARRRVMLDLRNAIETQRGTK
jgi:hypothetical protein